ncbi:DUF5050 domain-containing protein [uncultured Psychroserpens sp.]|uniref:DUF5050 domain-containing protein n=1 Tax=uncultured Psychroserpens sp. TaxID=255436 RepID=UPI00262FB476|nr:DUF5050 domain-containing protein [uncultured Psychroserpens sp.]
MKLFNTMITVQKFSIALLMALWVTNIKAQTYRILYTKQINNSDNICLIDTNGNTKQITNHSRKDSSPIVSPDGNFIVFTSERVGWWKIWTLDLKKNEYKQLTTASSAAYSPSWSPNGNHILFVSSQTGNSEVFVMDKHGKNKKNITNNEVSDTMPFWGMDNMIYYSSEINGTYQIVRMSPNGDNKEVLTKDKGDKLMPQLSNDGKTILYYGNADGNFEIYTTNIANTSKTRLTNHPLMDMRPRWSSDDKKIVFERGNKGDNHHVFIMDANGKNVKQLTFSNYNYAPSFVPNTVDIWKEK